ncbi:MAG: hypothetical protein PHW41_10525, partial [Eubacteriales bacterium]|nr:hypothetical protein [Eubacteriales bacterium]
MSEGFLSQKSGLRAALNWLFLLSGTALAGLLSVKGVVIGIIAGILVALATLAFLIFKYHFLERTFSKIVRWQAALSAVLAAYGAFCYADIFYYHLQSLAGEISSATVTGLIGRFGLLFTIVAAIVS